MAKSKLKSFVAIMKGSDHSSWSKDGKTYYNFTVEFENGDKGQASSTSTTPKWETGKEYTYDISTNDKGYTNIRGMKMADFIPAGNRNDPEENKSIGFQVCYQCAIDYVKAKGSLVSFDQVQKMALFFYARIVTEIDERRKFILACSALKMTISMIDSKIIFEILPNQKITKAEEFMAIYEYVLTDITNHGPLGSSSI